MRDSILKVALACCLAVPLYFASAGGSLAEETGKTDTPPVAGTPPPAAEQDNPDQEPARSWDYRPTFETDGKGGLYFEDSLRTQRAYPGVTDHVIQGGLEPNFFFIVHYPQGWGEKADAEIKRFIQNLAGEHIFAYHDGETTQADFFSKSHAKPDAVAAHERGLEEELRKEGLTREEYELGSDKRLFPIFVDYDISESPRVRSVNFRIWSYAGGAHDNWTYSAISLDKATDEAVTPDRLFSAPGSFKRVERWLNTTKDAGYYYSGSCATGESALERTGINLNSRDMMKKGLSMNRLVFTPEGLEVVFAPYEQGSFAMGDVRAPIPLKTLRALGANDRYWKEAKDKPKQP